MTYDIQPYAVKHRDQTISLLQRCFGPHKTPDNFAWKHEEGPWGPSIGWVAVWEGQVVGARLLVPWQVRCNGATWPVLRAVDGAVDPGFRRKGIFEALVRSAMETAADMEAAIYSTSVPASREAYRKLRWFIPDVIPHYASLAPARKRARITEVVPEVLPLSNVIDAVLTDWSSSGMAWRTDTRSGHRYRAARIAGSDETGLLYRISAARRLVVVRGIGPRRAQLALVGAVARRNRCAIVLHPYDAAERPALSRVRGGTQVSTWIPAASGLSTVHPTLWRFDGADLEGAI